MPRISNWRIATAGAALAGLLLLAGAAGRAQEKTKPETIQAQAMGQLKMTGKTFNVTDCRWAASAGGFAVAVHWRTGVRPFMAGAVSLLFGTLQFFALWMTVSHVGVSHT